MPTLALLDGHSLAYRAFFALPTDLATPSGQVTNAVYGFTAMVIKLLGDEHPDAVAVAWDTPEQTFRSERYSEYKAQRDTAPDLFVGLLPLIDEVVEVLGFPQFKAPGFEADDVIATLARQGREAGWDVIVVTGDRDAFQLVADGVKILYTRRGISDVIVADAAYVEERYGITPNQYVEYAALRGDPSDNLPGVPGVGEKTAAKLLNSYGSIEGIFDHVDEQTPKLRQNLEASREQVLLNRELARLVDTVPVEALPEAMAVQSWDRTEVKRVFDSLAFKSLWERLEELGGVTASPAELLDVETRSELDPARAAEMFTAKLVGFDPVWDGGDLVGLAVSSEDASARFVPIETVAAASDALVDGQGKVLHDAKETMRALADHDISLGGIAFDTALAAYVVNPGERAPELADLAASILGLEVTSSAAGGPTEAQGTLEFDASGPDLEGAGRRAAAVRLLADELGDRMEARGSTELYRTVELPLVTVLARMEDVGIGVDVDYLSDLGDSLRQRIAKLDKKIHKAAGGPFNVNSAQQLREILFDRLDLPVLKKTPKGVPSTDASVLNKLADEHPIVDDLLSYRELEKLRSTYVDGLMPLVADDGRIHAHFNQMAAATGRLSSDRPNLQNIPARSEEGMTIRRAFVADQGATFVVADYSQIELRILAHLSEDPGLVEAFNNDQDVHTATAARVWESEPEDVTSEQRRMAKVINFGLLYGMEAFGLAQRLEISTEEAQGHVDSYFGQFPQVRAFMSGIVAEARDRGYTATIMGRRRYLPELASGNFRERQAGERMALNAPIQGSAADIIKKAMIELDSRLAVELPTVRMLLQVHDELVFEVPTGDIDAAQSMVREVMEGIVPLKVPLRVDIAAGANLADCKN